MSAEKINLEKKSNKKMRVVFGIIIGVLVVSISTFTFLLFRNRSSDSPRTNSTDSDQSPVVAVENRDETQLTTRTIDAEVIDNPPPPSLQIPPSDPIGVELTYQLQIWGYDLGFIHSQVLRDKSLPVPSSLSEEARNSQIKQPIPLDTIIPRPESPQTFNRFEYPRFGITAPVQFATLEDLFGLNPDGSINFRADPGQRNYGVESPVQQKLRFGIAHLGFSPMPGEVGNSYIVGHTSNYSFVQSDYNYIFAPMVYKSEVGDEFIIYDSYGRRLVFRVFESLAISETDTATAYTKFPNRRVVTLQGSILETVNGQILPTKRWIVRGELQT